jgi:four helix bundle protein
MNLKTEELLKRTFEFAVNVLKLLSKLPRTPIFSVIIYQLAKAATSVGSNYEESQAAESKNDFIHKIGIVSKESRESHYWLRVLKELLGKKEELKQVDTLINEAVQLKKIFTPIKLSAEKKNKIFDGSFPINHHTSNIKNKRNDYESFNINYNSY